jgi:hypothetical protein
MVPLATDDDSESRVVHLRWLIELAEGLLDQGKLLVDDRLELSLYPSSQAQLSFQKRERTPTSETPSR